MTLSKNATGVKNVALTMGGFDKLVGRLDLDFGTGDFSGRMDPEVTRILAEGLGENLLAMSFYGKPSNPAEFQKNVQNFFNLQKGTAISNEISELRNLQKTLKDAFHHRELDGGPKAAMDHPLFLAAEKRIEILQEEMTLLV